ncbi:hypothetical protein Dda_8968 [Drechslerella dactyloides]|uniref:Uncharacterized protein n=1 Tax=Drechslerella dactyloides TaxID=74499 RepID=A0AAD6NGW1_DREDA|nr:hypothetical protein Dda_8968 [Drechslerella dactyloides]
MSTSQEAAPNLPYKASVATSVGKTTKTSNNKNTAAPGFPVVGPSIFSASTGSSDPYASALSSALAGSQFTPPVLYTSTPGYPVEHVPVTAFLPGPTASGSSERVPRLSIPPVATVPRGLYAPDGMIPGTWRWDPRPTWEALQFWLDEDQIEPVHRKNVEAYLNACWNGGQLGMFWQDGRPVGPGECDFTKPWWQPGTTNYDYAMSTAPGLTIVLHKVEATGSFDLDGGTPSDRPATCLLDNTESCRLIPEPRTPVETAYQYLRRCGNIAIVKDLPASRPLDELVDRAARTETLEQQQCEAHFEIRRLEREMDMLTLQIGLGNLQNGAIRKLKGRNKSTLVMPENNQGPCAESLIKWVSQFQPKDLPAMTDQKLRASDHAALSDIDYVRERNHAAHEEWTRLAVVLRKPEWDLVRQNWERIFSYVTGTTIDEEDKTNRRVSAKLESLHINAQSSD